MGPARNQHLPSSGLTKSSLINAPIFCEAFPPMHSSLNLRGAAGFAIHPIWRRSNSPNDLPLRDTCSVQLSRRRFVLFVAATMSMAAISIDLILPAQGEMRRHFGLVDGSTRLGLIITLFFIGMASGQLFYGTLSDRFGRRPIMIIGLGISALGSFAASIAPTIPLLFFARFITGFGAAGPRSLAVAMVRDRYEGVEMAKLMSLVMTVFMIVPIVAPSLGALLLVVLPWQSVLWLPGVLALVVAVVAYRMPETLPAHRRRSLGAADLLAAAGAVVRNRRTMAFTLVTTLTFSSMASYLGRSEPLISNLYGRESLYPIVFGGVALFMAVATLANSRIIPRLGLQRMLSLTSKSLVVVTGLFAVLVYSTNGRPPFALLCLGLGVIMGNKGLLMPNANTAAMEPMGAVAGTASSIIGVTTSAVGAVLSGLVTRIYDPSARTLALAMFGFACGSALLTSYSRRHTHDPSSTPVGVLVAA